MKKLSELGISPAPWTVSPRGNTMVTTHDGYRVAVGYWDRYDGGRANARLIAAAPELYDMLQSLVEYIDRECIPCGETACELMAAAHKALAEAAGEEVGDGK